MKHGLNTEWSQPKAPRLRVSSEFNPWLRNQIYE
jgi:hypothetical protein